MNPGGQFGQEAIANMEIEMMTDLYNRLADISDCTHANT